MPHPAKRKEWTVVDGVAYFAVDCVRCGKMISVAAHALAVADRDRWPVCTKCWNEGAETPRLSPTSGSA